MTLPIDPSFSSMMSLEELQALILRKSATVSGTSINYSHLPDDFSGDIPESLWDVHFDSPPRELLHLQMLQILDTLDSAASQEREAFFRYLRLITIKQCWHGGLESTQIFDSQRKTVEKIESVLPSSNPFVCWMTGITDLILNFLEPHEVVSMSALSISFHNNFWNKLQILSYKNLTLGTPWHRCPIHVRRLFFPRYSGIQMLRLEPVAASAFVAEDLDDLLRRSTRTLKRLYICSPCRTLLLAAPLMTTHKSNGYCSGHASTLGTSDWYDSDGILSRIHYSDEDMLRPGCHYFRAATHRQNRSFPQLVHLELSGNEAVFWAMALQRWEFPILKSLTLQTWTDDFTADDDIIDAVEQGNGGLIGGEELGRKDEHGDIDFRDRDVTMKDYQDGCCEKVPGLTHTFWKKTSQCERQRLLVFTSLLSMVSSTLWDLELVVPGGLTEDDFRFFQSAAHSSSIESADLLSRQCSSKTVSSEDEQLSQTSERPRFVLISMLHQFEDFCKLLQRVLFEKKGMRHLRKLEFVGISNFSIAVYGLKAALQREYRATSWETKKSLFLSETKLEDSENNIIEGDIVNRRHFLDPPFEKEPGQPFLPALDFQADWDSILAKSCDNDGSTAISADQFESTGWPDLSSPPIGRTLIVFSGTVQIPQRSCIELKCLYPRCIKRGIALSSQTGFGSAGCNPVKDPTSPVALEACALSSGRDRISTVRYKNDDFSTDQSSISNSVGNFSPAGSRRSSESDDDMHQIMMKLRVQQENGAVPPREFQRLQTLVLATRRRYLHPSPRNSTKGKSSSSKKRVILHYREAPQDASVVLALFSEATTEFGMFLGDHSSSIRQFSVMKFPRLDTLRIVNWYGGNRSHLALFNLISVSPPRCVHLTIETTDAHYARIRRKNPKNFYTALVRFASFLRARGMIIDRISFFPGPEEEFVANMNYFFPANRIHVGSPSRIFIAPFEPYGVPHCLFTIFPSDGSLLPTAREESRRSSIATRPTEFVGEEEEEDTEFIPTPPQLAINSEVLEVAAPLERGFSSIREFLVTEVERQSSPWSSGEARHRPSPSSMSVAWHETGEIQGRLPTGVNQRTLLQQAVQNFSNGCFYTYGHEAKITLSCHLGLVEFYKLVIGLRSLAVCTFTQKPTHVLHIIMQFDHRRFGLLDSRSAEKGDWFLETVILPWLTLAETFIGFTHCELILLNPPRNSQAINGLLFDIEAAGTGVASQWIANRHLAIVVLHPMEWNPMLCKLTLQLAGEKLGEASLLILKERAKLSP